MKKIKVCGKRDMFDFIEKGNTMYDILAKKHPILNNDFSTPNLLISLPRLAEKYDDIKELKGLIQKPYNEAFFYLSSVLLEKIDLNEYGSISELSPEQEELLQKLKEAVPNIEIGDSPADYIQYARVNVMDKENEELRSLIIKEALKYEQAPEIRAKCLYTYAKDIILHLESNKRTLERQLSELKSGVVDNSSTQDENKYEETEMNEIVLPENMSELENDIAQKEQELESFEIILETLSSTDFEKQYQEALEEYNKRSEELKKEYEEKMKEMTLKSTCEWRREKNVKDNILSSLSTLEKSQAKENGTINTILGVQNDTAIPRVGTFKWRFSKYEVPQIILNTITHYSENSGTGEKEDQRVIAVSYGRFEYNTDYRADTGKPTYFANNIELVGVTRVGLDGIKNYFVYTSFDDKDLKSIKELEPSDVVTSTPLKIKSEKNKDYIVFVQKEKIPEELKEYYAEVFFSDAYLSIVDENYNGYAGTIVTQNGKPRIMQELFKPYHNIEAIKYASKYPASCGNGKELTSEELRTSEELKKQQEGILNQLAINKKIQNKLFSDAPEGDDR